MAAARTADPWRDTDVIDSHAPRFNQTVVGVVALVGALLGSIVAALALLAAATGFAPAARCTG